MRSPRGTPETTAQSAPPNNPPPPERRCVKTDRAETTSERERQLKLRRLWTDPPTQPDYQETDLERAAQATRAEPAHGEAETLHG